MNDPLFGAFLATSLVLAVTPGPGVIYIAFGRYATAATFAGLRLFTAASGSVR